MAKQAILLHGTGGNNQDYYWFDDTKEYLTEHGYDVWWPSLPNTDSPELNETVEFIAEQMPPVTESSIIIAHSSSCPAVLNLLDSRGVRCGQLVLVGGFYTEIDNEGSSAKMLPDNFNWENITSNTDEIIMINSDNDPWGCTDVAARDAALSLGAKLVTNSGEGHMGSTAFCQPYRQFELLKRMLRV